MLAAELRYVRSLLVALAVFAVAASVAIAITISAHVGVALSTLLFLTLCAVFGFVALALWLPRFARANAAADASAAVAGTTPAAPQARYVPRVLTASVLVFNVCWLASRIPALSASHWKSGFDSFALLGLSTLFFAAVTAQGWLRKRKYGNGPAPIPPSTARRLAELAAAEALPTEAERRRARRPLRVRGFVRLGLLAVMVVLQVLLAPSLGLTLAFVCSFVAIGGTFVVLHRLFDL